MTAQIPDTVRFHEKEYDLISAEGEGLFDPRDFKLPVVMASTACWRGYVCAYRMINNQLELDRLEAMIGRYDDENFVTVTPPAIGGHSGRSQQGMFNTMYQGLALPICFTGELILGSGRTEEPTTDVSPKMYSRVARLRLAYGALQSWHISA